MSQAPLDFESVDRNIRPRFRRTLGSNSGTIYLANHSLGRPLDTVSESLLEFFGLWCNELDCAWDVENWPLQCEKYKSAVSKLVGCTSSDSVIPKTSAGQGLRAILNSFPQGRRIEIVSTEGEFDSIHHILSTYQASGKAKVRFLEPRQSEDGVARFHPDDALESIVPGVDIVLLSAVFFTTGQVMQSLPEISKKAHSVGAKVVLDVYHAIGVFPFSMRETGADFLIGGCYKYLRGGPGACFLVVSDEYLDNADFRTLDTGWFAKEDPFSYARPEVPKRAKGGASWMESTPPIAMMYQALPGLEFTLEIGVDRLRKFNLEIQAKLIDSFQAHGIPVFAPRVMEDFGAFVLVPHPQSSAFARELSSHSVVVDARGGFLRFGPDILTTEAEICKASEILGSSWGQK